MASIIDAIIRLKDQFTPTLSRVREQLTETQRVSMRAARDVKGFGESISGIGEAMLPAAVAITAGLGYSAMQFADFSYSIMRTANIAKKDGEDISVNLHRLEEAAIGVGSTLPMTINETSEAMANLARAGFDTNMIIGSIGAIGKAAEASGAEIALVSDVVTNAMSIWDLKSGDIERNSERVADVIQQACNKSKMSYDKFAIALATGGNIAASYGEQIEEVAALMGVFANQGIDASSIGTTLKNSYLRLGADADGAAQKLGELGVKVFDDSGKMRSMIAIMNDLHKALQGMSDAEMSPLLKSVFGMHAVSGMKKVLQSEEAMQNLQELDEAMQNAQGKSQEAFEAMQQTFGGKIKLMESTFDAFVHRFGLALADIATPALDAITSLVSVLNGMSNETFSTIVKIGLGFVGMTAGILAAGKAISLFGKFALFIGPIGAELAKGVSMVQILMRPLVNLGQTLQFIRAVGTAAFTSLGQSISAAFAALVANPVALAAIIAIGAIALIVAANWDTFKTVAETVWNKISYVVSEVTGNIRNRLAGLAAHGQQVFDKLVDAWNQLTGSTLTSGEAISVIINTLGAAFTAGFDIIISVVEFAITNIITIIDSFLTVAEGVITFITGVFTGNWGQAWEGIKTIFTGIFDGITGIFDNFINAVSSGLDRIMGKADTASSRAAEAARDHYGAGEVSASQGMAAIRGEGNALGTDYWTGGLSWVHEQGPELIDLPNGTRVIPHSSSLEEEYDRGMQDATAPIREFIAGGTAGVTYNERRNIIEEIITGKQGSDAGTVATGNPSSNIQTRHETPKPSPNITVTIPKLADQIFVREKADIENIVNQLTYRFQAYAMNRVVHAVR